jgi:hypothetical protein
MNPSLAFSELLRQLPRCFLLTSGTLTPFSSYESELRLKFDIKLENSHIINPQQQLLAGVLKRGPSGKVLNCSYNNRGDEDVLIDIGNALVNIVRIVPNGVLVFFPSYTTLNRFMDVWSKESNNILKRIAEHKTVVKEPTVAKLLKIAINTYIADAKKKGAIFFAVCKGKVSEGIDFTDELARAVILVGIPFPSMSDKRIQVKKLYLNDVSENRRTGNTKLSGKDWYFMQGLRATNQAIGRIIRHKNDFGLVLLLDERFDWPVYKNQISDWVRGSLQTFEYFGSAYSSIIKFFKEAPITQIKVPRIPSPVQVPVVQQQPTPISLVQSAPMSIPVESILTAFRQSKHNKISLATTTQPPQRPTFYSANGPSGGGVFIGTNLQERSLSPAEEFRPQQTNSMPLPGALNRSNSNSVSGREDLDSASKDIVSVHDFAGLSMKKEPTRESMKIESDGSGIKTQRVPDQVRPSFLMDMIKRDKEQTASSRLPANESRISPVHSGEDEALEAVMSELSKPPARITKETKAVAPPAENEDETPEKSARTNRVLQKYMDLKLGQRRNEAQEQIQHHQQQVQAMLPTTVSTPNRPLALEKRSTLEEFASFRFKKDAGPEPTQRVNMPGRLKTNEEKVLPGWEAKYVKNRPVGLVPQQNDLNRQYAAIARDNPRPEPIPEEDEEAVVMLNSPVRARPKPEKNPSQRPGQEGLFSQGPSTDKRRVIVKRRETPTKADDDDTITCIICYEKRTDLLAAKCGHLACQRCWDEWLKLKLECPVCKSRARKKHLTKIHLNI